LAKVSIFVEKMQENEIAGTITHSGVSAAHKPTPMVGLPTNAVSFPTPIGRFVLADDSCPTSIVIFPMAAGGFPAIFVCAVLAIESLPTTPSSLPVAIDCRVLTTESLPANVENHKISVLLGKTGIRPEFNLNGDLCKSGVAAFGRKPHYLIFEICGALPRRRYG
jgi:hypothetical protein